jgi:hypothetical protein
MEFVSSEQESFYVISDDERQGLNAWLADVIAISQPEDVTTRIFIDNLVDPEKQLPMPGGKVSAVLKRYAVAGAVRELTDVVIEGDVYETNAQKGILFDVTDPPPESSDTEYDVQFTAPSFVDSRHKGLMHLSIFVPSGSTGFDNFDIEMGIKNDVGYRMYADLTRYEGLAGNGPLRVSYSCQNTDMVRGMVTFRPVSWEVYPYVSLSRHANFIAGVIGLPVPQFLHATT